jgi:hypothetical protein
MPWFAGRASNHFAGLGRTGDQRGWDWPPAGHSPPVADNWIWASLLITSPSVRRCARSRSSPPSGGSGRSRSRPDRSMTARPPLRGWRQPAVSSDPSSSSNGTGPSPTGPGRARSPRERNQGARRPLSERGYGARRALLASRLRCREDAWLGPPDPSSSGDRFQRSRAAARKVQDQ